MLISAICLCVCFDWRLFVCCYLVILLVYLNFWIDCLWLIVALILICYIFTCLIVRGLHLLSCYELLLELCALLKFWCRFVWWVRLLGFGLDWFVIFAFGMCFLWWFIGSCLICVYFALLCFCFIWCWFYLFDFAFAWIWTLGLPVVVDFVWFA